MIKKDWRTFCRNVNKHITFSSLNIFGPLLGITGCKSIIMNYKKVVYNFIMLMALFGLLIFTGCKSSSQQPNTGQNPPAPDDESEFTIYYALNESHSTSWVQQSAQGVVGIVYGVFGQGTAIQEGRNPGSLVYKTIMPDGSENEEVVTTDRGVDKSVLLYDSNSFPHIFYARSDNSDQAILHVYQNGGTGWIKETVINFSNEGGRFIYELSADIDKNDSIHLLVLKTRSNPDSSDFLEAYVNSHLYHITNGPGNWEKTLIHRYDTFFTYDMAVKTQRRQDIAVDDDGYVHVVFGEQYQHDPGDHSSIGILHYGTDGRNYTGALPDIKIDSNNTPHIVFSDIASSHNPQNVLSTRA